MKTDNELIAEFMGVKSNTSEFDKIWKYDTSWDWIMPVVSKCYGINPERMLNTTTDSTFLNGDIQEVYETVVEFIKWYNSTLK